MALSFKTGQFTLLTLETVFDSLFSGVLIHTFTQVLCTHLNIQFLGSSPTGIT